MSKNFDLMQDAQIRLDIPAVEQQRFSLPPVKGKSKSKANDKEFRRTWGDDITREESSKFMQNIFLSRKGNPLEWLFLRGLILGTILRLCTT